MLQNKYILVQQKVPDVLLQDEGGISLQCQDRVLAAEKWSLIYWVLA